MKKRYLVIPSLALLLTAPFCVKNAPVVAYAEDEEQTSQVTTEEETVSSEETATETAPIIDLDNLTFDGKTFAEWKKELTDENTRFAAIWGIIWAVALGSITILSKFYDHKKVLTLKKLVEDLKNKNLSLEDNADKLEKLLAAVGDRDKKIVAMVKEAKGDTKILKEVLTIVMTHDPTLVAAGAFKKAMSLLEMTDEEAGEAE